MRGLRSACECLTGGAFSGRSPIDPRLSELCNVNEIDDYPIETWVTILDTLIERT